MQMRLRTHAVITAALISFTRSAGAGFSDIAMNRLVEQHGSSLVVCWHAGHRPQPYGMGELLELSPRYLSNEKGRESFLGDEDRSWGTTQSVSQTGGVSDHRVQAVTLRRD